MRSRFAFYLLLLAPFAFHGRVPAYSQTVPEDRQVLSLSECQRIAMERNHTRPASQFAVAIAEAQHRQALAAYWPQVTAKGGIDEMSSSPNFIYPASAMYIPGQSVSIPGGTATVTIPANAFGPGFPPVAVPVPVSFPGQTVTTTAQLFPIPAQNVKLMNPTTESISGEFKWLLEDGGMRRGYKEQSLAALDVAHAEVRRTDLELRENVTRLYFGAVLARQLHKLGQDTLERMEATQRMTESLYKDGTGTVNKTDFLDNKVMTETVRSMVAPLEANEASAEAALAYTIGLSWKSSVIPRDEEVPYHPYTGNLDALVSTAYEFNPDWAEVDAGLRALEGERKTAASAYYPRIGLKGELHKMWNSYDGGLSTSNNKDGWSVNFGVEIPIFDGLLTQGRVAEARARINQLKEKKILLSEGLGLEIRSMFIEMEASEKVVHATEDAAVSAKDDTELTLRGYQSGLVVTEKVIRAQLQEALISAAHDKAVYDNLALKSRIDLVVGKSVQAELNTNH
ncbi:MAG: TolC family protein [Terracidiphilus sp.]